MKNGIILLAASGLLVGCGQSSETPADSTPVVTATEGLTTGPEETKGPEAEDVTLGSALDIIGAKCQKPISVSSDCIWNGIRFTVGISDDWDRDAELRKQACDQGLINPQYLIATDGSSWFAAADFNDETREIAAALGDTGLLTRVQGYCQ